MLVAMVLAAATLQDPQGLVRRGADAAGGDAALRGVRAVTVEFVNNQWALGQSETWDSPLRFNGVSAGRSTMDFSGNRRIIEQEARAGTGQRTRARQVVAGGIGFTEQSVTPPGGNPGAATQNVMNPAGVTNTERILRRDPVRLLVTALDNPGSLSAASGRQTFRGIPHDGARLAHGPDTLTMWFDSRSGLLTVVETLTDDPVLGDRQTQIWYTRWHPAGAIRYPRQADTFANGVLIDQAAFTSVAVNANLDEAAFAIPDSLAARAQRGPAPAPAAISVTLAELSPGVWRAEGTTHHTLVVEQGNELLLVEAPQSTPRMTAVLDTLRSRFPGRRVSAVINTHYHFDHSGGVRAVLAAGLPVITHERNAGFINRVASAPKTIAPDELSRRRRNPSVRLVSDSLVVGGGERRVVVYRIPTVHSEDMLAVWVPSARVVFTSDVLNPAATLNPVGSRELVEFARSRGLEPERYAGGHGNVTNWSDIVRAAN